MTRDIAGKLNDPGKTGKLPGIFPKEGKFGNFIQFYNIEKKENCEVLSCL